MWNHRITPTDLHARPFLTAVLLMMFGASPAIAQPSVADVVAAVSPAVVAVFSYDEHGESMAQGSGFFVGSDGLIVTNYHVIEGAHNAKIKTRTSGEHWVVGVVALASIKDFAILKITGLSYPTVPLGTTDNLPIGGQVIAIGNPRGLEGSVSDGLVSEWRTFSDSGLDYRMIQHTAPISPGSSGGPLLNRRGQVIGINTSTRVDGQNLNFALPISYIHDALYEGRQVQWTLAYVAQWQEEQELKELEKLFEIYRDSGNAFEILHPRAWQLQQDAQWSTTGKTYTKTFLMAPRDAHRAVLHGYLSEGIRIEMQLPRSGYSWTINDNFLAQWARDRMQGILDVNSGFAVTDSSYIRFVGQTARFYAFVGENENITEPEKTSFIFVARPEYLLKVERVSPVSTFEDNKALFGYLLETFKVLEPAAPN